MKTPISHFCRSSNLLAGLLASLLPRGQVIISALVVRLAKYLSRLRFLFSPENPLDSVASQPRLFSAKN